jgi:transcriptional antiterminator RfaH
MIHAAAPATAIAFAWWGEPVSYWACARLEPHRERLALHCLELNGFEVYLPRLREHRISHGRKIEVRPPLFPGYCFIAVELQWHTARWTVGVLGLIMGGIQPARVPDVVIAEIRARERGGLVELPQRTTFRTGETVRVTHGPFSGQQGLPHCQRPRERVLVLLALLGGHQRVELAKGDVEAV